MVNQKLISFKCDTGQLEIFDRLCSSLGVKRNNLLNFLVFYANNQLKDSVKLNLLIAYSRAFIDSEV